MRLADASPSAMTNMKDVYSVTPDSEQNAVGVRPFPLEKLTYFEREADGLWRETTTFRKFGKGRNRLVQSHKPSEACVSGMLRHEPLKN